jgi:subtilisin family serine protease
VGDDLDNPNERYYGNNNVTGPEASHGTHTAGIIGAVRGNGKGLDGVANDVRIMVVRAVPWGDERDKDIANAIRYAVDNGATVINMSFGKTLSPDKAVVDDAVQYAVSKDVLLVHGAGNDGANNDSTGNFPGPHYLSGGEAAGWIEVGATGRKKGKHLVASFSNYGKKELDIFAPGEDIYSTMPGNKYQEDSGTSMAAPVVAGICALIREYFPDRKAADIKALLMRTVSTQKDEVVVPGTDRVKKPMKEISVSGGVVNAGQAVQELLNR